MLERLARIGQDGCRDAVVEPACASGKRPRRPGAPIRFARRGCGGSRGRSTAGTRARPARAHDRLAVSPRRPARGGEVGVCVPGPAPRRARRARRSRRSRGRSGAAERHPLRDPRCRPIRGRGVRHGVPDRQTADISTALLADFFDSQAWLVTRNLLFFFSWSSGSRSATGRTRTRAVASRTAGWSPWRRCWAWCRPSSAR